MDSAIFKQMRREQSIHHSSEQKLSSIQKSWIYYFFIIVQILLILYYALCVDYAFDTKPTDQAEGIVASIANMNAMYPSFQDVQVMVFIGFGFLMAYLKYHAWSSISFNFMIAVISIQFSIVCIHFWEEVFKSEWHKLQLNLPFLIRGDFAAATVLISYGAVIGKFNPGQYMMMGFLEVIFATLNQVICEYSFRAIDMGGSMYIHAFGAYFGLAVVTAYKFKHAENNKNNSSGYISNTFALLGTIFLFMYWPSFNSALAVGPGRQRIVVNTYFSIVASVVSVFIISPLWSDGKLSIENVLNSTIAGGVAAGTSADLVDGVYVSILTGFIAGVICSLGFSYLSKILETKTGLQDTAGVNNLHGLPGIFSAIVGTICVATMSIEEFQMKVGMYFDVKTERSGGQQAGYQFLSLIITLCISLVSGFIVGKILSMRCFNESKYLFSDVNYWMYEDEEHEQQESQVEYQKEQQEFNENDDLEQFTLKNRQEQIDFGEKENPINEKTQFETET